MEEPKSHFILVHGGCHGAWCWYKLATLLRSKGHRVTTPDLGASGINLTRLEELETISQYSQPLMDVLGSLPVEEKVILVAHSFGGVSVSLAMEKFPQKISVAVFATASMPGPDCPFTVHLQQRHSRLDSQLDNQFFFHNGTDKLPTAFVFGNEALATTLYQNCPTEVLTLARMLVRPMAMFLLSEANAEAEVVLSNEKYGLVPRVYILCDEDKILKPDFQMWMIENNPTLEVKEIPGADHMVMLSKPLKLCEYLHDISKTYS